MHSVIQVTGVRKTYGPTVAVDDVSFDVHDGEIFGLIGPNGAGKTTTMECIEGLRTPDLGTISVLGLDPFRDKSASEFSSKRHNSRNASRCGKPSTCGCRSTGSAQSTAHACSISSVLRISAMRGS